MKKEEFKKFMEDNSLSQSAVCKLTGISKAQLSQYFNGGYKGREDLLIEKLKKLKDSYSIKVKQKSFDFEVKRTIDYTTAEFIVNEAFVNNEMVVLYGESGTGKTTFAKDYVKKNPQARLFELIPGISIKFLLNEICDKLGISSGNNIPETIEKLAKELKESDIVLIFDETEHLSIKSLETIRRIWDKSDYKFSLVFVGTNVMLRNFKGSAGELKQLYARSTGKHEFKGLRVDEIKNIDEFSLFFGDFSNEIKKYTTHLRRAVNLYKKALRFSTMNNDILKPSYIKQASKMVFLD